MSVLNPRVTAVLAALPLALATSVSTAQTSYWAPSVSAGLVYDDNTTSSAGAGEDDVILRVTPELEGGWIGPRGTFTALHTFDIERYKEHESFDDFQIRRRTALDLDYRLSERLDVTAAVSTAATDAPGDLVPELGLELGRTGGAERHAAEAEFSYRLSPRATARMGAGWTRDDVDAGTRTTTLLGAIGASYVASARHTWTGDYINRRYDFAAQPAIDAHIVLLGWTTALSERASLVVQAGPRSTDGETMPEVYVATTWQMPASSLSANFARSQSTVIGQSGLADSHTAWLTYQHQMNTAWSLQLSPGWSRLERAGREVEVVRASVEARYLVNRNLSLSGSYSWRQQDGRLEDPLPIEIKRNVVFVGATWEFMPQPALADSTNRRRQ